MRESPLLARRVPLISTQVLGAITGFSPSAFATSEITGEFCAQAAEKNGRIAQMGILRNRAIFLFPSDRIVPWPVSFLLNTVGGLQLCNCWREQQKRSAHGVMVRSACWPNLCQPKSIARAWP